MNVKDLDALALQSDRANRDLYALAYEARSRIDAALTLHMPCHATDHAACSLTPGGVHLGTERFCACCSNITGHPWDGFVPWPCPTATALGVVETTPTATEEATP